MNYLIIDRQRMKDMLPQYSSGISSIGFSICSLLDFIAIREEDGTYTIVKDRFLGWQGKMRKETFEYFSFLYLESK